MFALLLACSKPPATTGGAAPAACPEPVLAPQTGFSTDDPVPADPHAGQLGPDPRPRHLHLGFPADPSTTVTVLWETGPDTLASKLRFGAGGQLDLEVEGASFVEGPVRVHEAHICGLEPATEYSYRAGGDGAWSDTFSFATAPADAAATVRIAVAGDSRTHPETWAEVLAAIAEHSPDLLVFTGDMVASGGSDSDWEAWFEAGDGLLEGQPFVPVHGNHELLAEQYFAFFSAPGNEQWFSLDWGPAHISVLNDTVAGTTDLQTQADWLEADLAATDRPWRIRANHQPTWSSGAHAGREDLRELWDPPMEAWPRSLVLNGHNHLYERTVPIRQGAEDPDGTTFVVTGGAGAPLYDAGSDWFTAVSESVYHYVILDISPSRIDETAWRLDGTELDSFSVELPEGD